MGMGQNGMRPEMIMPIGGGGPPGGPQLAMQMGPDGMRPEMLMPISGPGGPMIAMGMGGRRGSRGGGPEIVMPMWAFEDESFNLTLCMMIKKTAAVN